MPFIKEIVLSPLSKSKGRYFSVRKDREDHSFKNVLITMIKTFVNLRDE